MNILQELRERGFRLTPQREMVLLVMHQVDGLVTADEIHGCVRERSAAVDISTVYRTLDLLVQCGLVRKSRLGREHYFYEKMEPGGGHHHMVCTATGKIIEFWDSELDERLRRLCQDHKFRPSFISIQIQGLSEEGQKVEQETSFF